MYNRCYKMSTNVLCFALEEDLIIKMYIKALIENQ